ncbi:hypothetical protein [Arthrobacter psychrolactophilus]|nr:hypothetical protein [Arthrobacter psychrolactophilus]
MSRATAPHASSGQHITAELLTPAAAAKALALEVISRNLDE